MSISIGGNNNVQRAQPNYTRNQSDYDPKAESQNPENYDTMLKCLAMDEMIFDVKSSRDSDTFGKSLTAYEAKQKLNNGETIIVKQPKIGEVEDGRFPNGKDTMFRGEEPGAREIRDAHNHFSAFVKNEGMFVESYEDLVKMGAAEGLTPDLEEELSPEQRSAIHILKDYEGGVNTGKLAIHLTDDWGEHGYYFTYRQDHAMEKGIYDPNKKKGGLLNLGICGHNDRLTVYEAIKHLDKNKEIIVVDDNLKQYSIKNHQDLKDFNSLKTR